MQLCKFSEGARPVFFAGTGKLLACLIGRDYVGLKVELPAMQEIRWR